MILLLFIFEESLINFKGLLFYKIHVFNIIVSAQLKQPDPLAS